MYLSLSPALDADAVDAQANRIATASRAEVGELDGYLAFDGEQAIGWLNVQARHRAPHAFARMGVAPLPLDAIAPHDAAVVLCIVVAPTHDAAQVAPTLLRQGIEALRARGLRCVDAYPREGAITLSPHEPGPVAWYADAGFAWRGRDHGRAAMRCTLQ
jgi:hypothetical protein